MDDVILVFFTALNLIIQFWKLGQNICKLPNNEKRYNSYFLSLILEIFHNIFFKLFWIKAKLLHYNFQKGQLSL